MSENKKITSRGRSDWAALLILGFVATYAFFFFEWLFIITKPSFMSILSIGEKLAVFFFVSSLASGIWMAILLVIAVVHQLPFLNTKPQLFRLIGSLIPAAVLTSLVLLLIDNFTYTVFQFGIINSTGVIRGLYGLFFIILYFVILKKILAELPKFSARIGKGLKKRLYPSAIIGLNVILLVVPALNHDFGKVVSQTSTGQARTRPHILLITSDGVNANNMSVYGYERDTTPNLRELAKSALVAENAYTNSSPSTGSIISMLTGKYPATTRLLYPPDILKEQDSYQHLPGILRAQGYYTVQLTMAHYLDAYAMNLLDGFDKANGRSVARSGVYRLYSRYLPTDFAYFLYETTNRIAAG